MNWEGLILDEETGRFTLRFAGGECRDLYAQVKLQDGTCLKTTDMKLHKKRETEVTTEIGSCRRAEFVHEDGCLLYTSPSPRDGATSRMPSSA